MNTDHDIKEIHLIELCPNCNSADVYSTSATDNQCRNCKHFFKNIYDE